MVSVSPWVRGAAAGARVGGELSDLLGRSCSEIRFRPLNSEEGTARETETKVRIPQRGSLKLKLVWVKRWDEETVPS